MRMAFFFDQSRCMGCNTCTVACKDTYNVNPGPVSYRKHETYEIEDSEGVFYPLVMSCNHCENPICVKACSVGAITKRSDGIVYVDRSKCQGLQACILMCPFAAPDIADRKQEPTYSDKWISRHPMQKCNLCMEMLDRGEETVCVRACPAHAIQVGDFDKLMRDNPGAVQLSYSQFKYAYTNDPNGTSNTGPSFIIKPRKPLTVTGSNR